MAIVQNPLIGRTRRSIGNATFAKWKEHNVLKTKKPKKKKVKKFDPTLEEIEPEVPLKLYNKGPHMFVLIFRAIQDLVRVGMKSQARTMTEYNVFMSDNMNNNVFLNQDDKPEIETSKLIVSKGSIPVSEMELYIDSNTNQIEIAYMSGGYPQDWEHGQKASDELHYAVVLIDPLTGETKVFEQKLGAKKRDSNYYYIVDIPSEYFSENGYLILFTTNEERTKAEDSQIFSINL